jgi:hypothetical protein
MLNAGVSKLKIISVYRVTDLLVNDSEFDTDSRNKKRK